MSADITSTPITLSEPAMTEVSNAAMLSTMRKQRIQDFIFHKVTMTFSLSVLFVLVGIIISLILGAMPALQHFGPAFITTVEWDPVNDNYGALIAIVGTLATAGIALLIAFPVSFGIALFLTEICRSGCAARWARPSSCWPACRPSSTACGACSCSRRCSATTCSPS